MVRLSRMSDSQFTRLVALQIVSVPSTGKSWIYEFIRNLAFYGFSRHKKVTNREPFGIGAFPPSSYYLSIHQAKLLGEPYGLCPD